MSTPPCKRPKLGIIELANAIPLPKLHSDYVFPEGVSQTFTSSRDHQTYTLHLETSSSISAADMQACFDLVRETSRDMYRNSNIKWSPAKKRREMKLPDLRYLLVRGPLRTSRGKDVGAATDGSLPNQIRHDAFEDTISPVEGFLSFMLTYEDGHEVIYCYELHLSEHLRGCGLGRSLMGLLEDVGRRFAVDKAMLTVFLANEPGLRFYENCGYTKDDYSPSPTLLRNGKTKEPSYVILSKPLADPPGPDPVRKPLAREDTESKKSALG